MFEPIPALLSSLQDKTQGKTRFRVLPYPSYFFVLVYVQVTTSVGAKVNFDLL